MCLKTFEFTRKLKAASWTFLSFSLPQKVFNRNLSVHLVWSDRKSYLWLKSFQKIFIKSSRNNHRRCLADDCSLNCKRRGNVWGIQICAIMALLRFVSILNWLSWCMPFDKLVWQSRSNSQYPSNLLVE